MFGFRKNKKTPPPDIAAAVAFTEAAAAHLAEELFASAAGEIVIDDERFKFATTRMFRRLAEDASKDLARRGLRNPDTLGEISARYAQRKFEARWHELQSAMPRVDGVRKQ